MNLLRHITLASCIVITSTHTYDTTYLTNITNRYLSSRGSTIPADMAIETDLPSNDFWSKIKETFNPPRPKEAPLSQPECCAYAFKTMPLSPVSIKTHIADRLTSNLEMFEGNNPENRPASLIATLIDIEHTSALVQRAFVEIIAQPITEITTLKNRQDIIRTFLNQTSCRQECNRLFEQIRLHEKDFFTMWCPLNSMNRNFLTQVYSWSFLNKDSVCLEGITRFRNLMQFMGMAYPAFVMYGYSLGISKCCDQSSYNPISTFRVTIENFKNLYAESPATLGLIGTYAGVILGLSSITTYQCYKQFSLQKDITAFIHQKMISFATFLHDAKDLYLLLKQYPTITNNISSFKALEHLMTYKSNSASFNDLLYMLDTNTFTGSPTLFSFVGRILAAYTMLLEMKDLFLDGVRATGEIGAYLTVANLIDDNQNRSARYCLASFIMQERPYLSARNFWNCFVPTEYAVANDIELGGNNPRTMVLTGPNTGGKSTVLKAVLIDIILAQTLGIACADEFTFTPFTQITGYMNLSDDIALGASRFKAEVLQSKAQISAAQSVASHEFSFNVRDEGIVGTDREVGEKAEYIFSKQLGEIPNSLNIMATHYPKLTLLEQYHTHLFKNYQMEILVHEENRIERTFLLKPGVSKTNIALNILLEEGVIASDQIEEMQ